MNLIKNELGVFLDGYETYQVTNGKSIIRIRLAEEVGKWGYSLKVDDCLGGYGGPLSQRCLIHSTRVEACKDAIARIRLNDSKDRQYTTPELIAEIEEMLLGPQQMELF